MIRRWLSLVGLISLLLTISISAWASTGDSVRLSSKILAQSGLADLLTHYPVIVKNGLRHNVRRVGMPEKVARMFENAVDVTYDIGAVNAEVLQRIEAGMSDQQMREVLQWFRSPIGQKISQAELSVINDSEYASLQQELDELAKQYAGSDREQLFPAFDRATRATESMLDNAIAVELAMAASLTALVRNADLPDFSELKALVSERRMLLRGQVGQQVYMNYLYTYRDLSLQELQKYIDFARSENGNRFLEVVNNAVFDVLEEHSARLGHKLNPAFGES
ncbi:hypothetical protein BTA51_01355 [Hahella sp. CCB-MM4]|uniref:DUF2059 domain-containing protein n=1 Tax=Hahella sp. (strain CCB-MM4) TaxID=1926491 RepID=UPI000B9BDB65|nr:DUF2059 domain-containing protein [Hahella sp. CCB-MM4]OZG75074.1 hypothetical protein BTA51_01355 [Hahella sp. CCB-MM4]